MKVSSIMTYEDGGNVLNMGMWANVKYVNNLRAIHVFPCVKWNKRVCKNFLNNLLRWKIVSLKKRFAEGCAL